ncbi:hypothetical protein RJ640_028148 [Escallonia rubra]|uniref:Uncharacterized protein n=1 Tax=Escallonia rubra TaxID=112253 RepID=A0AA88R102_9ASTE|nr:hypothetical protein RJ640_028148 [Escallonia rubra]
MNDWAAPLIAAALFAFLAPGLIFQLPGRERPVDFLNMKTSVASILLVKVHPKGQKQRIADSSPPKHIEVAF